MSLLTFLAIGLEVMGSCFDGKVMNLTDMSEASQKRYGYTDADGYWTEKGWARLTSADYEKMSEGSAK